MQGFYLWKLQKAQEAQLSLTVYSKKREIIFRRWFRYVHEELP